MTEATHIDFPTWTPIAARGREPTAPRGRNSRHTWVPGETMGWLPYPDAPVTIEEARALEAAGHLLTMSRHLPDRVVLEIRSATPSAKPLQRRLDDLAVRYEIALAKSDAWLAPLPPKARW